MVLVAYQTQLFSSVYDYGVPIDVYIYICTSIIYIYGCTGNLILQFPILDFYMLFNIHHKEPKWSSPAYNFKCISQSEFPNIVGMESWRCSSSYLLAQLSCALAWKPYCLHSLNDPFPDCRKQHYYKLLWIM